jgi:bis(5'-nucleosidyl)-tetraphosphatase
MPIETSAGAIIFRRKPLVVATPRGKKEVFLFLLLHYKEKHWDLPKGHIEKGETLEETTKREVKEETGISNIEILPKFKETIKYFFKWNDKNVMKFVTFFLAETKEKEVKLSDEHIGFEWLEFEAALEKLTFKNAKEILKKANDLLSKI